MYMGNTIQEAEWFATKRCSNNRKKGMRELIMKKRIPQILIVLCLSFVTVGCGRVKEQGVLKNIKYSNLQEKAVQDTFKDVMEDAAISKQRQEVFFRYVDMFNQAVSEEALTKGYEEAELSFVKYDPYAMQEEWTKAYPDFMGYNCRITAFSLFADFVDIPKDSEMRDEMILLDMYALEEDTTAIKDEEELKKFKVLFSTIPTKNTKDIAEHVKQLQKDWKERGIRFDESASARLITVLFHEYVDETENYLFIGHTGVLFPHGEELFFIEKVAFQEPYQLILFKNRIELNDYLMTKYDNSVGQPTARPFIMENDRLLEGYRQLSNTDDEGRLQM